jgi:hypothetical protein
VSASLLAEAYRRAALANLTPRERRDRVQEWLNAYERAGAWTRLRSWASCWDLDKTDRRRVQSEVDRITIARNPW